MMSSAFDHENLRVYQAVATLDVHALRQAKSKPVVVAGKNQLVDVECMLTAWERSLEEN